MPNRLLLAAGAAALSTTALAACSSSSGQPVAVTASDSACTVDKAQFASGDTTFNVENKGDKVTEVYVYASGDKVMTEKENIGPGTRASFNVKLPAGDYEVACKPGQTGNGIRTKISVTGQAEAAAPAGRKVEVSAKEFSYGGLEAFSAKTGESVKFELKNEGTVEHELEIDGPDGGVIGEVEPIPGGATGDATVKFTKAGTYNYKCDIDSHAAMGMKGSFTVT